MTALDMTDQTDRRPDWDRELDVKIREHDYIEERMRVELENQLRYPTLYPERYRDGFESALRLVGAIKQGLIDFRQRRYAFDAAWARHLAGDHSWCGPGKEVLNCELGGKES